MNLQSLLQNAWYITRTNWALWLLSLLTFVALLPSALLAGGLGAVSALLSLPPTPGLPLEFLESLRAWPWWQWALVWLAAVAVLVLTTLVTYFLQAATMRGVALAAERGTPVSFRECLALGPARTRRLIALSFVAGTIISALSLLPTLARVFLGERFGAAMRVAVQAGELTFSTILSLVSLGVFLMVLALAVEDVQTRQAPRRAWAVFRKGWWAFLLIVACSALPAVALAALTLPIFFVLPIVVINPDLGIPLTLACCCVLSPVGLGLLLLVAVFTNTLYTLVYRAAAQLADTQAGATA